jgi:hypothetical protein
MNQSFPDWASQPHRHSMSGYTVLLHSSLVAWSAQKQTIIALSTAKVEYIALTAVMHEILYLQQNYMNRSFLLSPSIAITKVPLPLPLITSFTHAQNISTYDITMSDPWYGVDNLIYSIVPWRIILPTYLPRRYQGHDSQSCEQVYD